MSLDKSNFEGSRESEATERRKELMQAIPRCSFSGFLGKSPFSNVFADLSTGINHSL